MPVKDSESPRQNHVDSFTQAKIIAVAKIAGRLIAASLKQDRPTDPAYFALTPDQAAESAEKIFDAVERRILGKAGA